MRSLLFIMLALLALPGCQSRADRRSELPIGWQIAGRNADDYRVAIETSEAARDGSVLVLASRRKGARGFVTVTQEVQAYRFRGSRLQLSAYVKADAVEERAALWMRIDGFTDVLSFDDMSMSPITGTREWGEYAITFDIPPDAMNIAFGLYLYGPGKVEVDWFDLNEVKAETIVTARPGGWKRPPSVGGYPVPLNLNLLPPGGSS